MGKRKLLKVSSFWSGKYAKTRHGLTPSLPLAIWWFISWSVIEFIRVLRLNKYHYGNILGIGKKLTDSLGRIAGT
ncbi:MAG TPA: hypothetical protein VMW42_12910 [Desulfatiglandales bacterium]|nr:hypothetical protein [Desulfatiglandales bacterium]